MRLVHISDLHFGCHDPALAASLAEDISAQRPDLVVVSGDFTEIGSEKEFLAARDFLETVREPVFAVPGNHDVPSRNLIRRFFDPYGHYRRFIADETEPFLQKDGVAIAGINTSRRIMLGLNWGEGRISSDQLEKLKTRFARVAPETVRVVVAHHPLLGPETPVRIARVHRADRALATFAELGVRLVLSGHFHMSYVRKHEPGMVGTTPPPGVRKAAYAPILVAQTSTTTSKRLRGEPNAYNVIDIRYGVIGVGVREWREGIWTTRPDIVRSA